MKTRACLMLSFFLAACGGGGGGGGGSASTGGGASANSAPRFTSPASASAAENQGLVAYSAAASDSNNDALTYSVSGGADQAAFTIDAGTGELSFLAAPDFEAPGDADGDNTYEVVIRVQDSRGGSDTLSLSISVDDDPSDNGFPEFTSPSSISISENETDLAYQAAADDPDGTIASIVISGGSDQSHFVLDSMDQTLTFASPKDFEAPADDNTDNQYQVELQATDDEGKQTTLGLTVTVTNVDQPRAEILFPTVGANVGIGRNTEITVTARLYDDEDGISDLDFVTANGFHLAPSVTDPDFWAGRVPLAPGENDLDLAVESVDGFAGSAARTINNILPLGFMSGLVIDPGFQSVFVSQAEFAALQRIDMTTGEPQLISTNSVPTDLVFSTDGVRTFILHPLAKEIYELDVTTGVTRLVYQDGSSSGTPLNSPSRIEIDEMNDRLVVLDITTNGSDIDRLIAVDIATGASTVISDDATGSGPQLIGPRNLAVDPASGLAYVVNRNALSEDELLSVDLSDGTRSIVSSGSVGLGPMPPLSDAVVLDGPGGLAWLVDYMGAVTTVDLNTGDKTPLADRVIDHHTQSGGSSDLARDNVNQRLILMDPTRHKIWAIDTQTGSRDIFYETPTGTGPGLESSFSLVFDESLDRLLVVSQNHALIAVDLDTGNRTVLAGAGTGSGPTDFGSGIAPDLAGGRVFVPGFNSLLEIDLATGNRAEFSGPNVGFGLQMQAVRSPVFDASNGRVLVIEGLHLQQKITAIDLASGDRSIFSDTNTGTGPGFAGPLEMMLDAARSRLLVTQNQGPVLAVDLATGDRSVFSGAGVGSGPDIPTSYGISLDTVNDRVFVSSFGQIFAIDATTGDRVGVSSLPGSMGIRAQMSVLAWDARRNLLYSPISGLGAIVGMDLHSSDTAIIAK